VLTIVGECGEEEVGDPQGEDHSVEGAEHEPHLQFGDQVRVNIRVRVGSALVGLRGEGWGNPAVECSTAGAHKHSMKPE
jgi:hypothetical protein